jgi:tetratricopeptide (TPR) repeat protein
MSVDTRSAIDGLYAVGHWLLEQERNADAMDVFRAMLIAAPEDERGWLGLGECHDRLAEHEKAAVLYALAAQATPDAYRCVLARARVLRRLDAVDRADEAFAEAIERALASGEEEIAARIHSEWRMS